MRGYGMGHKKLEIAEMRPDPVLGDVLTWSTSTDEVLPIQRW